MPLMHKKTPKAFKHNIETEMHAGKPQKQAVAIAYSEKRRAEHQKHSHGGMIEDCSYCKGGMANYDEGGGVNMQELIPLAIKLAPLLAANKGGEIKKQHGKHSFTSGQKGVHESTTRNPGESYAGSLVRDENSMKREGSREEGIESGGMSSELAKGKHQKVLGEMRSMKKPNLYARGGAVDDDGNKLNDGSLDRNYYQKGTHNSFAGRGSSQMGAATKGHWSYGDAQRNKEHAISRHEKVMSEMKGIKPNLYAHGGEVEAGPMDGAESQSDDDSGMDAELHSMMGEELMHALDRKDKKAIMESIEAIVLSCLSKGE